MGKRINKKEVRNFQEAYKDYRKAFNSFNSLDKSTRNKITKELEYIESKSSVEIEQNCPC